LTAASPKESATKSAMSVALTASSETVWTVPSSRFQPMSSEPGRRRRPAWLRGELPAARRRRPPDPTKRPRAISGPACGAKRRPVRPGSGRANIPARPLRTTDRGRERVALLLGLCRLKVERVEAGTALHDGARECRDVVFDDGPVVGGVAGGDTYRWCFFILGPCVMGRNGQQRPPVCERNRALVSDCFSSDFEYVARLGLQHALLGRDSVCRRCRCRERNCDIAIRDAQFAAVLSRQRPLLHVVFHSRN